MNKKRYYFEIRDEKGNDCGQDFPHEMMDEKQAMAYAKSWMCEFTILNPLSSEPAIVEVLVVAKIDIEDEGDFLYQGDCHVFEEADIEAANTREFESDMRCCPVIDVLWKNIQYVFA